MNFERYERIQEALRRCARIRRRTSRPRPQIYWNGQAEKIKLSEEHMKQKLDECRRELTLSTGTKTMLSDWPKGSYRLDPKSYRMDLFVRDRKGRLLWYYCSSRTCNTDAATPAQGSEARKYACRWVKERTGKAITQIYGQSGLDIRFCTPKQFYYCNDDYTGRVAKHMNCIDACSQYPSGFLGDMPTTIGAKVLKGTVKPTKDYPFAFYLKSGHLAILDELDTHDWLLSPFRDQLFQDVRKGAIMTDPKKDTTVLMRKAETNPLRDLFIDSYAKKESFGHDTEEYQKAKLVMNSLIGMMHQKEFMYEKTGFRLAHLPAIAIARGNQKILRKANQIGLRNIAMIVVDSIIYKGLIDFGTKEKEGLGTFHQEVSDADYRQLKTSTYAFFKDGRCVKYKHGSSNADADGNDIQEPKTLHDMDGYKRIIKKTEE